MAESPFRLLPAVHRLMSEPVLAAGLTRFSRAQVLARAREVLDETRRTIAAGASVPEPAELAERVLARLEALAQGSLRRVINASGVVLNTNFGRALLAPEALAAMHAAATTYGNLEYDLETGERGSRHDHLRPILQALTGAEDALVVNNNAAAVMLVAAACATAREVVVSRGQLVEIGGSFRLPEVILRSGARLREVGTTNKTHASDYVAALSPDTGLLLRSHTSNYRIEGFTAEVSPADLAAIGREHRIPTCEDLGSGQLLDLSPWGLPAAPTVADSVAAGLDLVTFSGDKLLGGPQAGLIVGRTASIARLRRHPLLRAIRPDKLTLAALQATLALYLRPDAHQRVPTLAMLTRSHGDLSWQATTLATRLRHELGDQVHVDVLPGESQAGGGAWPGVSLPTTLVALRPRHGRVTRLVARLRHGDPALVGRIQDDHFLIDPRTLSADDLNDLPGVVVAAVGRGHG